MDWKKVAKLAMIGFAGFVTKATLDKTGLADNDDAKRAAASYFKDITNAINKDDKESLKSRTEKFVEDLKKINGGR